MCKAAIGNENRPAIMSQMKLRYSIQVSSLISLKPQSQII
jgi:hypothetical protein